MTKFFFFNDTATTEIYTLSLHDALPIWLSLPLSRSAVASRLRYGPSRPVCETDSPANPVNPSRTQDGRSEEHTSELQSRPHLVCRLLLEKKKNEAARR